MMVRVVIVVVVDDSDTVVNFVNVDPNIDD